jgi:hypothetical protein
MKTKRLLRLQILTVVVLVVYSLFAIYIFFAIPNGQPMWGSIYYAGSEIKSADLPRLQADLHSAVSSFATFQRDKNELLFICLLATVGIVGFLGWSAFMMGRIKREADHAA